MQKVGIVLPYWNDITKDEIINIAKRTEEFGYSSIWVPEMWGRDPITLLSILALNTRKIEIGSGIISVYSRTPAAIAQTVATLDEISEGRMNLGLGTSGRIVIEDWHGIRFDSPLRRTKEYIDIIRMILKGEKVNYNGEIFKLKNFSIQFKTLRNNIPIYLAAIGPKNIRLTGELADGWIPFLVPKNHLKLYKTELKNGAELSNRDYKDIITSPYIPCLASENQDLSKKIIKEHIAHYIGTMGTYYYNVICRSGFSNEADLIVDAVRNRNKNKSPEYVSEEMLRSLSICGTKTQAKIMLEEFCKSGADMPVLMFPPKSPREIVYETIENMAPDNS